MSYPNLIFALMGGAVAWLVRLVVNTWLVGTACTIGSTWPLWLTTAAATLVAGAALARAWSLHRPAADPAPTAGSLAPASLRWLGGLGVLFNVTAIAGILLESAPIAVLDVCAPLSTG